MTVYASDLVEKTRRHLRQVSRERLNTLNATITSGASSLVLATATPVAAVNDYIAVDYEVMLVTAVSGTTLTVLRGMLGTTAAAHTAAAHIEISPRFPRGVILQELAEELRSWPNDLYRPVTVEIDWPSSTTVVELPTDSAAEPRAILAARRQDTTGPILDARVELVRGTGSLFASGYGLRLPSGWTFTNAQTLWVTYAAKLNVPSTETWASTSVIDDAGVGLADSMMDIPAIGAAWRALQGAAFERLDLGSQGQTRRAEEVKGLDIIQVSSQLAAVREKRIGEEANRLRDTWGVVF